MSELFKVSYDMLTFELTDPDVRQHALRTALAVPLVPFFQSEKSVAFRFFSQSKECFFECLTDG